MSHFSRRTIGKAYAVIAGLTIVTIAGPASYALGKGVDGRALTASLTAIAGLGGAGIGRLLT